MSEAIKPTPGPWYVDEPQVGDSYRYVDFGRGVNYGYICRLSLNGNVNTEDNARLIAEAGTVHHETGLTPRQLVERVKELEEAAADFMEAQAALDNREGMGINAEPYEVLMRRRNAAWDGLEAALSKALPNTVAEVK